MRSSTVVRGTGRLAQSVEAPSDEVASRIARLEAELADQARQRAELVNAVGHELRTPITVLRGFLRLLENRVHGDLNGTQSRFVTECLKSCERLDAFVSDLLEARTSAATLFSVCLAPARLHRIIEAQIETFDPLIRDRNLSVEMRLAADDAPLMLDERRVEQVITNLMANAIRHARTGGVIRVETGDRCDAGAARVEVSIEDDGEGVAQADRERIFEPYVRGVDQPAGLGIGLTLCRRIMEAHGGSIRVENSALGGARFVLDWSRTAAVEEKDVDEIG